MSKLDNIRDRTPDHTKQRVDEDAKLIDETIAAFKERLKVKLHREYFEMHEALFMAPSQLERLLKLIHETP